MENKVSIIVPIYNASTCLCECLESVRKQSCKDWTCILVNDGSTDNSQSIIDEYCALDDRFVSVSKQNEKSAEKARLYGLKYVKSDFVVSLDADDMLSDDYVERLVRRQRETDADTVYPRMCWFEKEIKSVIRTLPDEHFDFHQVIDGKTACSLTMPDWVIGFNGGLKRTACYNNAQCSLTEGNWAYLDEIKSRERLMTCRKVAFSDAKYYYRTNPSSITKAISSIMFDASINDAYLVRFAQKYYPDNKTLINALAQRHFSNLRKSIVNYEKIKDRFSEEECKRVEMALAQSYSLMDIGLLVKRNLKWGLVAGLLRRFSRFQHFVVSRCYK